MKSKPAPSTAHKEFLKRRDAVLPDLITLEKKHRQDVAVSAMRKRITFLKEESKRMKGIAKLEGELKELRTKIKREKKGTRRAN